MIGDKSAKGEKDTLPAHLKHFEKDPPLANAEVCIFF